MATAIEQQRRRPMDLECPGVRGGLSLVRLLARASLALQGTTTVVILAVGLAMTSFGLDRTLRLAVHTRGALLAAMVAALALVAWRRLLRPLLTPLPDDELARVVEARFPALEWRLLSAVQFCDPAWRPTEEEASPELAGLVVGDAERLAATTRFGSVVPPGPALGALFRGLIVALAGGALVVGFPGDAATWVRRNLLLSATVSWPKDTHLTVLGFPDGFLRVPRGSELAIAVVASGVVPGRVLLDTRGDAGAVETLVMDSLGEGRFRTTLDRVTDGFDLVVRGGDDEVGPLRVDVVHRPWIEELVFQVTSPPHTGLPVRRFGIEDGRVGLAVGTQVEVTMTLSKPVRRAWLTDRSGEEVAAVYTGVLAAGARVVTAAWTLERSGLVSIEVEDRDGLGLEAPAQFALAAQVDAVPEVALRLVGAGTNVTPEATLRVRVAANDDYGVVRGALRTRATGGAAPAPVERSQDLQGLSGQRANEVALELELAALQLAPTQTLALWGEATDADPRGPNTGLSPSHQLRIVTAEQLLNELLRRLHEQRLNLERMFDDERRLAQGLAGEDERTLERAPRAHRDVGRVVLGAADVVDAVVEEMVTNKLLDASTWDRLRDTVAGPLRALHGAQLRRATELAEAAVAAEPEERARAMRQAGDGAAAVAAELRAIIDRMDRVEQLAELVAALKRLIRRQRDLLDRARQQQPPR